jgi:hypothetical protein
LTFKIVNSGSERARPEDNIKMHVKEIGYDGVYWIQLIDRDQ